MKNSWADANRISDQIIAMINAEREKPDFSPLQVLAGQCLGLLGYLKTAPPESMPLAVMMLQEALEFVLVDMTGGSRG